MRTLALAWLCVAVAWAGSAGAAYPDDKQADGQVTLTLTVSVKEYDPKAPSKGVVKCVVKNGTDRAVEVPAGYQGRGGVALQGNGVYLFPRKQAAPKGGAVKLEPGKELTAFELPLDDVLLQTADGRERWGWEWDRRPAPPKSPILAIRSEDRYRDATFIAVWTHGGKRVASNAVELKVKGAEGK